MRSQSDPRRKLGQLCREAERTLTVALASVDDPLISSLTVVAVEPAPDANHLAVVVSSPDDSDTLVERLRSLEGYLRAELASAITRKKPPMLWFVVM